MRGGLSVIAGFMLAVASALPATAFAFENCFEAAAAHYPGVDTNLLKAIALAESCFVEKAVSVPNKNGSIDIGVMQINSSWLPILTRHGISRDDLLDACTNIDVGAWLLAQNIRRLGKRWKAVGAYNAKGEAAQREYVERVRIAYNRLQRHEFSVARFLSGAACKAKTPRRATALAQRASSQPIPTLAGKAFTRVSGDDRE